MYLTDPKRDTRDGDGGRALLFLHARLREESPESCFRTTDVSSSYPTCSCYMLG